MPCQCANPTVASDAAAADGCECATDSTTGCGCTSPARTPPEGASLERIVMELDLRVRKLESRS